MANIYSYGKNEIDYLKSKDEKMSKLIDLVGHLDREVNRDFFTSLISSIIGQQISTAAHITINKRINDKFGELTPEKVVRISDEELQSVGLSFRKVRYIKNFASKVFNKEFDIDLLYSMTDEEAIKYMITLDGVGQWTAEMMLIFAFCREDIISYGDYGIRKGVANLYGVENLTKKEFHILTDKFSPYRTIASFYFWNYANNLSKYKDLI